MEKRMIKKLLALLMIITILAADFFVLGSNLITYAAQIVSATDNPNIEFSAYFKNQKTREDSIESSIKNQDLKLYAEIKVNGDDGYLVNGTSIEILDSNFNITSSNKGTVKGNKVILNQISAGETVEVELGITPIISEKITTDFLSKTSIVKLNSKYKYSQAEEGETVTADREVCVNYQPDSEAVAELETKIITNKELLVNGTNKRIVQLLIKSRLTENQYPVESTKLTVNVPQLGEEVPTVSVMALGKLATNGTTKISNIDNTNGTLTITLDNAPDENKLVNWNKNVSDELVVTFEYPESVDVSETQLTTNSEIKLYNVETPKTQLQPITIGNEEINQVVIGKTEISTEELYKGQLYANITATEKENVQYETTTILGITNTGVVDQITIHEGPDVFAKEDNSGIEINTKYVSTKINKAKMLEILGNNVNIQIKNGETPIKTITAADEADKDGNIVVTYTTDFSNLDFVITGQPEKTGILELNHVKEITTNQSYDRTVLQQIKTLETKNTNSATLSGEQIVTNSAKNGILELKETVSKAELVVENDKGSWSTTDINTVTLGITLVTDGVQYDLFKNPKITLQMPSAVESVTLNGIEKMWDDLGEFGQPAVEIKGKVVEITLNGEQHNYPAKELYLQLGLNIELSKIATSQTDKITMTYTNQNASQYADSAVELPIQISAQPGLLKMFNITSDSDTSLTETLTKLVKGDEAGKIVTVETLLINNTESHINNIKILGKLPTTGNIITDKENTLQTTLAGITAEGATVYYSENANATANSAEGWTTEFTPNAKLYLIELGTLSKGNLYRATINVKIPETIPENVASYAQYEVTYDEATGVESSRKIGLMTSLLAGIDTTLTAQVGQETLENGDIVREGEVIKYTATVTNHTGKTLENIEVKANVPEGTVLVQPKEENIYEIGYYDEMTDEAKIAEITSEVLTLAENQSYTMQYEVRVKTDITEGTEISNQATITYNNSSAVSGVLRNTLKEANIRVSIKDSFDEAEGTSIIAGATTGYDVYIENLSDEAIKNLKLYVESENFEVTEIPTYGIRIPVSIGEIPAKGSKNISIIGKIKENIETLDTSVIVKDANKNEYRSNVITEELPYANAEITMSSDVANNAYVEVGDIIKYNITVKNTGNIDDSLTIRDMIPSYLRVKTVKVNGEAYYQNTNKEDGTYVAIISNEQFVGLSLQPNEQALIELETEVIYTPSETEIIDITNKADVEIYGVHKDSTDEITHKLVADKTSAEDLKNMITGFVWIDTNKNGQKDNDEKTLAGVEVKLNNSVTDGNVISTTTTGTKGKYTFTKIPNGSYVIEFAHHMEDYESAILELNNLQSDVSDMNIGLIEKTTTPDEPVNPETPTTPEEPTNPENPTNPDKPSDKPTDKPVEPEEKKTISGLAWLDVDRDGQKDGDEEILSGIKVRFYDAKTRSYLKDEKGKVIETTTDAEGRYTFKNVEKGSYILLFKYDVEEYEPTTYFAEGVDTETNSKVLLKKLVIDGKEVTLAVTDTIKVEENVSNINIGLKEKLIFDLELNKYISRIVVQTSKETKAYDFENKTLAKAEIHRKQIQGALVVLEYTIKVKNNGEMTGYAKNIVDYLPSGLTFSSELNKDWYLSGSYLYTKGLENVQINPGEEKEVKLILTKTMTSENAGLINNRAEIYQDYNIFGDADIDSTPNNQAQNEDDLGSVDVFIGISTGGGSSIAYFILIMINFVLIGIAVKLMIKNRIIRIKPRKGRR